MKSEWMVLLFVILFAASIGFAQSGKSFLSQIGEAANSVLEEAAGAMDETAKALEADETKGQVAEESDDSYSDDAEENADGERPTPAKANTENDPAKTTKPIDSQNIPDIADFEAKALAGDAYAQAVLGWHYWTGFLVKEDAQKASELFWKSARQNHPLGLCGVADLVNSGEGGNAKNAEKAKLLYQKARPALESLATSGDSFAQAALGRMYGNGLGLETNHAEAIKWYQKAAAQGSVRAQHNLANMYSVGEGVKQNAKEASQWYRKAAEQGYSLAQDNLGNRYFEGEGVRQNYAEAVKWFRKAAEQGYASAQSNLGTMYSHGKGVEKDDEEAVKWYQKAAEQGLATAQFNLGVMYSKGLGVEQNDVEALRWYQKAADQGLEEAKEKVAELAPPQDESIYEAGEDAIKVKGLYIGMNIRNVPAILKEKLAGKDWGISDTYKGDAGPAGYALTEPQNYYVMIGGGMPLGTVIAGPNRQVIRIAFTPMVVNDLFNAADMDASAFAMQFMQAYHIPPMELSDDATSYNHTTEDGVKISIESDKTLVIEKVASKMEREASFD